MQCLIHSDHFCLSTLQVQHRWLWGYRRRNQHCAHGQLALHPGQHGGHAVPLQRQRFGEVGGRAEQTLRLHHLLVLHHDQPDEYWLRKHRPNDRRRENLCCGHDDDWMWVEAFYLSSSVADTWYMSSLAMLFKATVHWGRWINELWIEPLNLRK